MMKREYQLNYDKYTLGYIDGVGLTSAFRGYSPFSHLILLLLSCNCLYGLKPIEKKAAVAAPVAAYRHPLQ